MNAWVSFIFIIQFSTVFSDEVKKNDPCTSPNSKNGTCVPVSECQVVYNMLTSRNNTVLNFVRKSYCGYENEALVCCEFPSTVDKNNYDKTMFRNRATCGIPREEPRIFGGETAEIGEFPWVISVEYKEKGSGKNGGTRCVASLISDEYAVTAAYCIVDREYEM
ncbi:hypothetical protein ILUMI_09305 [Ignelater luminosus]|uniref:Clip domain-containing protein n=1 Tax=Ignelater luminosus TaxID=2038154 RepID=A0A8K0D015_IGNLU|nr:hypothetical protein ILUMI_09305 [Ignelater luminosus]